MKRVNVNQVLQSLNGEPLAPFVPELEDTRTVTLANVCMNALMDPKNSDNKTSGETKVQRLDLALAIHKATKADGFVNMANNDIANLKKLINSTYAYPLIVGQALKMLDDADAVPKEERDG